MKKGLSLLCLLALLILTYSWSVAGKLTKASNRAVGASPTDLLAIPIMIDSTISAWHLKTPSPRGVIVLCHGIRSSRLSMVERARLLQSEGYASILIDLQAHGESQGERITVGHLEKEDVSAAVSHAQELYPNLPVGVIGISLGGASALLSSPLQIDALIIESVFPTLEQAVHNRVKSRLDWLSWVPSKLLLAQLSLRLGISPDQVRPIDFVEKVECPLFLISGKEDQSTTKEEALAMFNKAVEPKQIWLVDKAAHVDIMDFSTEEYSQRIVTFLDAFMIRDSQPSAEVQFK